MSADEQAQFLNALTEALNDKAVALPSFPDVVVKIRTALEDPTCSADRLAEVAKTDPVLVSRLLMTANSAFHNRAGIEIVDLSLAIGRLGFETVRNSAITLAVEQIFQSSKHPELRDRLKTLWDDSVQVSSMCFVLAQHSRAVNADNAFLCGLLSNVGELYVLSQARDYPSFLGDADSLNKVIADWSPNIGKSIVNSWGFSSDISDALAASGDDVPADDALSLTDVLSAAKLLANDAEEELSSTPLAAPLTRLGITADSYTHIGESYEIYVQSMRQTVAG